MTDLKVNRIDIPYDQLLPHEHVIEPRKKALIKYLMSYEVIIIPTILVCEKSLMIIDGHHRYFALIAMGVKSIPVNTIHYSSERILTHENPGMAVPKIDLILSAKNGNLYPPKTTKHVFLKDNKISPIILLSELTEIRL